ncbi:MAG: DUF4835 family protein [Paludibacteraceae bacterium]|nr:DUF4835 family protein [Paludibacteraceae bacterium]
MRKHIVYLAIACCCVCVQAQELNCKVVVNSDQIEGSNKSAFETLQQSITEYMNTNRWTNLTFAEKEKIDCSMMIIVNSVEDNFYKCEMQLQSNRPVYGTNYTTPLLNFKDNAFNFTYQEFDRIEYQQNSFTTNLTAMLAYYVYLILGYDGDSFQKFGGTPYFQACEDIVTMCQSASMSGEENKGWKAFDSNRNRYALINNLMDEAFKPYREYYYTYHRLALDNMTSNVGNARALIAEGLPVLKEANRARPTTYVVTTFLDAKSDELVNIFKKGTDKEKKSVYDLLMDIDPTRVIYEDITK